MWDNETARRYDAWFQTPPGAFALTREIRLIERLTSDWPRRGQRLLEIGCGTGIFLDVLHGAGFDVTGLDASPAMLEAARRRLGAKADLHLGDAGHLPFDDNAFEFGVLLTVLEFCPDPALALREAARVTKKALLVGYLNRCSCYGLSMRLFPGSARGPLAQAHWFTPCGMGRLLRASLGRRSQRAGSVLAGPKASWREAAPWRQINAPILSLPVGAYCADVVSLADDPVMTPLPALKAKACLG
ncbi:MAG: class I SAM-dependent methyltransferase [Solidesulfovibrio sp.]|uniref:class I SAM-dependent methyltransferase n=1 Tax=Solidesulfovibrio sp. TaxID=2910990 RepID=UPI002B1EFB5E|nr:class I SAM-dependent methyltransferase [Solidesulfovibrio sp.]MEA4857980.1 class I SAM-dependent methyltransferase [Solidesulfovibrio sp.]